MQVFQDVHLCNASMSQRKLFIGEGKGKACNATVHCYQTSGVAADSLKSRIKLLTATVTFGVIYNFHEELH